MWPFKDMRADAQRQLDKLTPVRDKDGRMFRGCQHSYETEVIADSIPVLYRRLNKKYAAILASDSEKAIFERALKLAFYSV